MHRSYAYRDTPAEGASEVEDALELHESSGMPAAGFTLDALHRMLMREVDRLIFCNCCLWAGLRLQSI